jgi:hypothetical protein
MSKKVIKLTQSDLIKHITNVVSEQVAKDSRLTDSGAWSGGSPGPGQIDYSTRKVDLTLDSSLFANGVSKIDVNSDVYKRAVNVLKSYVRERSFSGGDAVVGVVGGASAVGSKQKYNNTALALNRAKNFIEAVSGEPGLENLKFILGNPVVGKAEVKNSPEAMAEQFVKIYLHREVITTKQRAAIDNTANFVKFRRQSKNDGGGKIIPGKTVKVCFEINESQYAEFIKRVTGLGYRIIK